MRSLIRPQDWPIAVKLLVAFLLVALIPLAIVGIISPLQARQGLLQSAQLNLINAARRTSEAVDNYVKTRRDDVQLVAKDESVVNFLLADRGSLDLRSNKDVLATRRLLASKVNAVGRQYKPYYYIARVDKDPGLNGRVELTSYIEKDLEGAVPPGELNDVSNQTYFLEASRGFYYISDPILTDFGDSNVDAIMYYSSPVLDTNNNVIGVIVARSLMSPIWELVNGDDGVAGTGSFGMLIDNTNRLAIRIADSRINNRPQDRTNYLFGIMRNLSSAPGDNSRTRYIESGRFPDNFNFQKAQQPLPNIYESAQATYNKDNPFFATTVGSDESQVGYTRVPTRPNWYYYVVVPQATYAAAANNITNFTLIVVLIALVLVILLAFLAARLLTAPVRRIGRALTMIGMGNFDTRVPITSQDELGRLGESLNAMFDNTLTLIQTREEKEELQERITVLLTEISAVAEGDLTVEADVTADITGAIADSFNLMIEELRRIIVNIQQSTVQANVIFDQVVANTQRTDQAADRQGARILNVSNAIGDINKSIQQVSENTTISAQVAQEARQNAYQGGQAVFKSINSMNRIRGNVQETAKKIKRLGESSQQIGEIVKLIDDIADQTNMLALNAAIQATAAGEQGKGFSVVAEEVRRLAERSAVATREIAALVKSIQDDTNEAVVAMEESTREVVEGSKVADEAGRALSVIEKVVERLASLIVSISQVTQQQAGSSGSIAQSMNEISSLTMEAASLRRESASALENLANIVQSLNQSVSTFRLASSQPAPAPQIASPQSWPQTVSSDSPFATGQFAMPPAPPYHQPTPPISDGMNGMDFSSYFAPPAQPTTNPNQGSADAGEVPTSRPKSATSNSNQNFNLESIMEEEDDGFFESIFGDTNQKNRPSDGRPNRPA